MTKRSFLLLPIAALLLLNGCKSEQKYVRYATVYDEHPLVIYTAPLYDLTVDERNDNPDSASAVMYQYQDSAAKVLFQSLPLGLTDKGYEVVGQQGRLAIDLHRLPLRRDLLKSDISRYKSQHNVDAVLVSTLLRWKESRTSPSLYVEFTLRSTLSGKNLLHAGVCISRTVDTNWQRQLMPTQADYDLAQTMGTSVECALRCYAVQQAVHYILRDLPYCKGYPYQRDLYLKASEEYYNINITSDGALEVKKSSMEEFENGCFL
ncbi:MAG: hypothetical protein KBT04_07815 [Bacteroidales bacterium]|nr:hypothetical protein [Candidatus Colimorpha onthohippi]